MCLGEAGTRHDPIRLFQWRSHPLPIAPSMAGNCGRLSASAPTSRLVQFLNIFGTGSRQTRKAVGVLRMRIDGEYNPNKICDPSAWAPVIG